MYGAGMGLQSCTCRSKTFLRAMKVAEDPAWRAADAEETAARARTARSCMVNSEFSRRWKMATDL